MRNMTKIPRHLTAYNKTVEEYGNSPDAMRVALAVYRMLDGGKIWENILADMLLSAETVRYVVATYHKYYQGEYVA